MWWLVFVLCQVQAQHPKEALGLADQARGLPPEFSADTLLQAVSPAHFDFFSPSHGRGSTGDEKRSSVP